MVEEISPEEVQAALEGDDPPLVVDIRSPAAYRNGHVPGSENIPFGDLPDEIDAIAGADHVVTVCPHGEASVQAARLVESYEGTADARVQSMAGGLDAWEGNLESGEADTDADAGGTADAPF